jgi:hypothetical protein
MGLQLNVNGKKYALYRPQITHPSSLRLGTLSSASLERGMGLVDNIGCYQLKKKLFLPSLRLAVERGGQRSVAGVSRTLG